MPQVKVVTQHVFGLTLGLGSSAFSSVALTAKGGKWELVRLWFINAARLKLRLPQYDNAWTDFRAELDVRTEKVSGTDTSVFLFCEAEATPTRKRKAGQASTLVESTIVSNADLEHCQYDDDPPYIDWSL